MITIEVTKEFVHCLIAGVTGMVIGGILVGTAIMSGVREYFKERQ